MFDVLLLSTGAGGVGLTLTQANRVVVYDPSWNPSQDAQAVDRAYRIGQTREVRVYRLFMAGSIEEKMYEKQVHKSGLEKTIFTEGNKPERRYFDKHELCKVFAQIPDGSCDLLKTWNEEGIAQVLDPHRHDLVRAHPAVVGISNHSTIYGQKRKSAFSDTNNIDAKRFKANTEVGGEDDDDKESSTAVVSEDENINNQTLSVTETEKSEGVIEGKDEIPGKEEESVMETESPVLPAGGDDESIVMPAEEIVAGEDSGANNTVVAV